LPSSETFCESTNLRSSVRSATSYRQTYLERPPASRHAPSAEKARLRKHLPPLAFLRDTCEMEERPPVMSRRPSMVAICSASLASQSAMAPSSVLAASVAPSGLKATSSTSAPWRSTSMAALADTKSHTRTVLSHEPDARKAVPETPPEKARDEIGPSWPESESSSCAVCMFHT